MNIVSILLIIGGAIAVYFLMRSMFLALFSMQNYDSHQKRLKELRFGKEKETKNGNELVETVTGPVIKYILPRLKPRDLEEIENDLKMAEWDKAFTAQQYISMNILLKIVGIFVAILIVPKEPLIGIIFFIIFFFLFGFLFKNQVKENKKALFSEFPEFIQIIQGFLLAKIPMAESIEKTLPYVGQKWKPLLKELIVEIELYGMTKAINNLTEKIGIFEVREFFSLILLNLEQGINIEESFSSQNEKIEEMKMEVIMNKIVNREIMAKIVQGPLLLTMIIAFGLPTIYQMLTFNFM